MQKARLFFLLVIVAFSLLLLLPKEMEISGLGGLQYEADYPFTMELYKENIQEFVTHFREEKGFGTTISGVSQISHMLPFLKRSLKIIVPAFLLAMTIGTVLGILLFYVREKKRGRVISFFAWMLASIPDFFLFIAFQYFFIILMRHGLPKFNLYSHDDWYSFIIPTISLTLFPLFHMIRVTAVAMEAEASKDYVRTAMAKGLYRGQVISHLFWNAWRTIVNQSHMVMLYIVSSLPIIEKLANYNGAAFQLLDSIRADEAVRSLLYFLPHFRIYC